VLGALLLACPFGLATAQARTGIGRASLTIPVQITIRTRLRMTAVEPPQVIARTADQVEMEFAFVVSANVDWTVTVALPGGVAAQGAPAVRSETGAWTALASGSETRVVGRMAPSNGTVVRVRVRLPAAGAAGLSEVLRFSVDAADGLPGD